MKQKGNYLSVKDSRAIIRYNIKQMKHYEAEKRKPRTLAEYTVPMRDNRNLIEIDSLKTCFFTDNGTVMSVNGVSFDIPKCKIVGVVGESGCGKSVTSLSIMQLVQAPQGQVIEGQIRFNAGDLGQTEDGRDIGYDIAKTPTAEMYRIRGKDITMIFQEPMTSLNPVFTIGYQLDEASFIHNPGISAEDAKAHSIEMLKKVGISMPEHTYASYPHELSGGMRQRVMIAMALVGDPKLIIADEPTTALDVTIQAQILELINRLKRERNLSIIFITHDLGVVANMADKIAVMYAGKIVEYGTANDVFYSPAHPYTWALLSSMPDLDTNEKLEAIPGTPPNMIYPPVGDAFAERNKYALKIDFEKQPPMFKISDTHMAATWLLHPDAPHVDPPKIVTERIARMTKLVGGDDNE